MKKEINEDMLKQCCDIEIECHDITKCRRKKFYGNTSELSRDIKFRRYCKAREVCCDISKLCHKNDLEREQGWNVATNSQ